MYISVETKSLSWAVLDLATNIGDRIRLLREQKGWSTYRLSKAARVASGYLSEVENGLKKNPSAFVLARIAQALGTSVDYLVGNTNDPSPITDESASLSPTERLERLGAMLRSEGATEEDVKTIMELLESRRRLREAVEQTDKQRRDEK